MVQIFPVLLILASKRIEDIMGWDLPSDTTKRGSLPSVVEYCILAYVAGVSLWYSGQRPAYNNVLCVDSCYSEQ